MNINQLVDTLGSLGQVWPDSASLLSVLVRRPSPYERQQWRQLLRAAYGKPALSAGYAIFGRDLGLRELANLQAHQEAYRARVKESASLAPLLAAFVKVGVAPPSDYGVLRTGALARGLTPAAWKWLSRQRPSLVRALFAFGWTPEFIFWTNLLARARAQEPLSSRWLEAGRPYMLGQHWEHLSSLAQDGKVYQDRLLNLERFLRLLPSQTSAELLVEYELLAAALHMGFLSPRAELRVEPKSTWNGLLNRLRKLEAERLALAERVHAARAGEDVSWRAHFGEFESNGVAIKELTSNADLVREGVSLSHCVGDGQYVQGCLTGQHVIASLQLQATNQRATLQLRHVPRQGYVIGQLAGPSNSRVPQVFWRAARDLQASLS